MSPVFLGLSITHIAEEPVALELAMPTRQEQGTLGSPGERLKVWNMETGVSYLAWGP